MPRFLSPIDLVRNELRNFRLQHLASHPSSPETGLMYYNTTDDTVYIYVISDWVDVFADGSGIVPELTGDVTTDGSSNVTSIASGVITNAHIDAAAGIALSKLATDPLARANHTGSQAISTITGLQDALDAKLGLAGGTMSGAINMGGQAVTNLPSPSADTDAATKGYVDAAMQGLDPKPSVRAASTADIDLSTGGELTIDAVELSAGERVLVKDQTDESENGIYTVSAGAWARSTDTNTWIELTSAYVWVEEGTANGDSGWLCTVDTGGTLGTDDVTWTQFSGAGQITAGTGLTKTGNTLAIDTASGYGSRKVSASIGDGSTTSFLITHNLGTRRVKVEITETASPYATVHPDVERTTTNAVTIIFTDAPTTDQYDVIIMG